MLPLRLLIEMLREIRHHRRPSLMPVHHTRRSRGVVPVDLRSTRPERRSALLTLQIFGRGLLLLFLLNLKGLGAQVLILPHLIFQRGVDSGGEVVATLVFRGQHSSFPCAEPQRHVFLFRELRVGFAERVESLIGFLFQTLLVGELTLRNEGLDFVAEIPEFIAERGNVGVKIGVRFFRGGGGLMCGGLMLLR